MSIQSDKQNQENTDKDNGKNPQSPKGHDWGEHTRQVYTKEELESLDRGSKLHRDVDEMRMYFGLPQINIQKIKQQFQYQDLFPDCIYHEIKAKHTRNTGGTDWLCTGDPGCGKSTLALYWAIRLLDINNEIVVWRGSPSRSEWLPLRKWTHLCIPKNADVEAKWQHIDKRKQPNSADLKQSVRKVIRYDSLRDLNSQLQPGVFHVVYPDPSFSGCNKICRKSSRSPNFEWYSQHHPEVVHDEHSETPLKHWWFAWMLDRIEHGPYEHTSLMFDETGDLFPADARQDEHKHYEKISMFKDAMVDARKFYLSIFFLGHDEEDLHPMVKRKIRWRISMPGEVNPRQNKDNVVGFNDIPMTVDFTSKFNIGKALMWNSTFFERIEWSDIQNFPEDKDRWLKIEVDL